MYSTCIFCHSSLGKNEAIEQFPIGRKLAFDGAKGRLWAVCAKCGRWNLTPIEERWEAIEECEKQFRGTILRSSTDQIGLARIREGTDLIRIGEPLRPEFAAWRYGRHFNRRRRVQQAAVATSLLVTAGIWLASGAMVGFAGVGAPTLLKIFTRRNELGRARKFIVERAEQGFGRKVRRHERVVSESFPRTTSKVGESVSRWTRSFWIFTAATHFIPRTLSRRPSTLGEQALAMSGSQSMKLKLRNRPRQYFRNLRAVWSGKRLELHGVRWLPEAHETRVRDGGSRRIRTNCDRRRTSSARSRLARSGRDRVDLRQHVPASGRRRMLYAATGVAIVASAVGAIVGGPFSLVPSLAAVALGFANRQSETIRARNFIRYRALKDLGGKIWQHERVSIRIIPSQHAQGWALRFALDGKFLDFEGRRRVSHGPYRRPGSQRLAARARKQLRKQSMKSKRSVQRPSISGAFWIGARSDTIR